MFVHNFEHKRQLVERILDEPPEWKGATFEHVVDSVLRRRAELLQCIERQQTPCYLLDRASLHAGLTDFRAAMDRHVPRHLPFYAVKSNHHPQVVRAAVDAGYGLDVSSGRELRQALATGAKRILFSGPAKSAQELALAVAERERVCINLDSFRELRLLAQIARERGAEVDAGVRIYTGEHGAWSKFGIPLASLPQLVRDAAEIGGVRIVGIQSHSSWTHDAAPYVAVIEQVADVLRQQFSDSQRRRIRYYDFGGGYRPHGLEGRYPTGLALGELIKAADDHFGETSQFDPPVSAYDSVPVEDYARDIGAAVKTHLAPLLDCQFYSEPGRIIAALAMHLVLRVVDKKSPELVIVDGGIHMVGWERYLHVYAPIVNLTRPATRETPVTICGSLCDPEDLFGYGCFGEGIEEGDVLLIPNQGAYTFVTAQSFIRDIPPVVEM